MNQKLNLFDHLTYLTRIQTNGKFSLLNTDSARKLVFRTLQAASIVPSWSIKTIQPSPLKQRVETLIFSAILPEKCIQADALLKFYFFTSHEDLIVYQ